MMSTTLHLSNKDQLVHYVDQGEGEVLVLLHGVGMQAAAWKPQLDYFAKTHRVIAINMAGHGGSATLDYDSNLGDFVEWLHQVLVALDLTSVNIAGHSMGALIAGGYASTYPENVKRVALLNGVCRRSDQARDAVIARAEKISQGDLDIAGPLSRWFSDDPKEQSTKSEVEGWLSNVDPIGYDIAYRAFANGDALYADKWPEVTCPALFLTGDGDPNSTADMSRDMARLAPNGKACIIEGHRHMVNLTAPDLVNDALALWLNEPTKILSDNKEM